MKKFVSLFVLLFVIWGCGGGSGGEDSDPGISNPVDKTPPTAIAGSEYPTNGSTNISTNSTIQLKMSEDLDLFSIVSANIRVTQGGNIVSGILTLFDGERIVFTPTGSYIANQVVSVTISGVKDLAGNAMAAPYAWSFTTRALSDTTAPTVVSKTPADGAIDVPITIAIIATIDEELNPATIHSNSIKLVDVDATTLTGSQVLVDGVLNYSNKLLSFTPVSTLLSINNYRVIVDPNLSDMSGNKITVPASWSFTTVVLPGTFSTVFSLASGTFYSLGGAAQATFDKATGVINVLRSSNAWDVSLRWSPLVIEKDKSYQISFNCSSVPIGQNIEIQLKQLVAPNTEYAYKKTACTGLVSFILVANDKVPATGDPAGRVNINFGSTIGSYSIGPVTVKKLN